jgi:hypothetical protein
MRENTHQSEDTKGDEAVWGFGLSKVVYPPAATIGHTSGNQKGRDRGNVQEMFKCTTRMSAPLARNSGRSRKEELRFGNKVSIY